ncbi:MAG: hypothetical protein M1823_004414 [Watsoniomyces obsoletus]|nr:MAG: hypothetical protein M1823_004414 [Watsoniomyces obsoletus]
MRSTKNKNRVIIHFDYDCFYAAVVEKANPALKSLPLGIYQKHCVTTMNYEARKYGLYKLQSITDARRMCPDLILVSGEDLTPFRDASKQLCRFLKDFIWSEQVETLGFDEVFLDVTDMIDYNLEMLNGLDLQQSFFHLSRQDPTQGFPFDATSISGSTFPPKWRPKEDQGSGMSSVEDLLYLRLLLGSHLATYLQRRLLDEHGYSATVGIATSKLLAKLVGSVHKPNGRTTLVDDVAGFMDAHPIGRIPGLGFQLSQRIRQHVQGHPAGGWQEHYLGTSKGGLTVADVRRSPGMGPQLLEGVLSGPGFPRGIGMRVWELLNGIDREEVKRFRTVPRQISIEDSYRGLDNIEQVQKELWKLARSLIIRMRTDLTTEEKPEGSREDPIGATVASTDHISLKWIAFPKNLRLSTRPPMPQDGDHLPTRVSRSCQLPSTLLNLQKDVESIASELVSQSLLPLFRKLHPSSAGFRLSLINIAVTDIALGDTERKTGSIERMFKQDLGNSEIKRANITGPLKDEDYDRPEGLHAGDVDKECVSLIYGYHGSEDFMGGSQNSEKERFSDVDE